MGYKGVSLYNAFKATFYLLKGDYNCQFARWTPHPVIVSISDTEDNIRVPLCSNSTDITGWGVLLIYVLLDLGLRSQNRKPQAS